MEDENLAKLDALIQQTEESLEGADEDIRSDLEDRISTLKSVKETLLKEKENYENQKKRAEKAEAELKAGKDTEPPKKDENLSQDDLLILIKADVKEKEDIEIVRDYAKLKNISIADALKSNIVKTILAELAEERRTAEAAASKSRPGGTKPPSGDELLFKAERTGELPESDEEMEELINARIAGKRAK